MFWQLYRYRLKRLANDKVQLFWLAIFPIILGTFFHMAFSEISSKTEQLGKIPVAVLEKGDYPNKIALDSFLDAMAAEDGPLAVWPVKSEEEAEALLTAGEVDGLILIAEEICLEFQENGLNQTILKHLLDRYLQGEYILLEAKERGMESLFKAIEALSADALGNEERAIATGNMDPYVQYYFALIAMSCMYAAFLGLVNTQEIQADQTKVAARRCISPVKKGLAVFTDFLAAFTVQAVIFLILYLYLRFGLKISFGDKFGFIFLAGMVSNMNGIAFGYLMGIAIKAKEAIKTSILTSTVLALSFLSGLMVGTMKFVIENNAPFINWINPTALSSNCFYYICIFDNRDRYFRCILTLILETLIMGIISISVLKKEKYKSL